MNIIVCVKQVPGTNKVDIDPVTSVLKRDGVAAKLNPYDLFALETAFSIKEQTGGMVKTLSMGPPNAKVALEETLWMGADESILLSDPAFGGADVAATSYALSLGIERMAGFDLIICGKQTTDGDTAQVGPELAERLGIEHAANVVSIDEIDEKSITVTIDLDTVLQTQRLLFPCLITVDKDINTPRLPSFRRRMAIDTDKKIKTYKVADFPDADRRQLGLKGSPTQVERIFPPEKGDNEIVFCNTAEELYTILKNNKIL